MAAPLVGLAAREAVKVAVPIVAKEVKKQFGAGDPDQLENVCHELEEILSASSRIREDARFSRKFPQRIEPRGTFEKRLDTLEEIDKAASLIEGHARTLQGAYNCKPAFGQAGATGAQIGGVAGGLVATAALAGTPAAPLIPFVAPAAAAAGAEAGRAVETQVIPAAASAFGSAVAEGRKERQAKFGDLAFGAMFTGREAATNLARLYQENTREGAFVYYDTTKERWVVELGQPTDTERQLLAQGRIEKILPGEKPPRDPKKSFLLVFPPATTYSSGERPTLLDAVIHGGRMLPGAEEQAPCDCATIPETGKRLCTREGVIGILRQEQIPALCSDIREVPNGRVERSKALREAQEICGTLVEGIEDVGERFGTRFTCLRDVLSGGV